MNYLKTSQVGDFCPVHGGVYVGIGKGNEGEPDGHIFLLKNVHQDRNLNWLDAIKWAASCGTGARLPTVSEAALLFANARSHLSKALCHWTNSEISTDTVFVQDFKDGFQYRNNKYCDGIARAILRIAVVNPERNLQLN